MARSHSLSLPLIADRAGAAADAELAYRPGSGRASSSSADLRRNVTTTALPDSTAGLRLELASDYEDSESDYLNGVHERDRGLGGAV